MTSASNLYALSLDQCADLITAIGPERTVVVQGDMGSGKTSGLRKELSARHPNHLYVECDCTNKDIQDFSVPKFMQRVGDMISDYVEFVPNAELGAHLGKPVIINFDEFLKAPEPVKKGVRRIMLERMVNGIKLPEGSIVYGTSNLGSEGVGDTLQAHQRNAIIVVRMRKSTNMEWIEWGINNGIHTSVLAFAKDNPQIFQSFEEVKNPDDNPDIYHPMDKARLAFITGRSLETASRILHKRGVLDDQTIMASLIGSIGPNAAQNLMAVEALSEQLPSRQSIVDAPNDAKLPSNVAALCMVVFRALATMDREFVDPWMRYFDRLPSEAQSMFVNGVRAKTYAAERKAIVMTNARFTKWCGDNGFLFTADK
jgi:hypothetical protein